MALTSSLIASVVSTLIELAIQEGTRPDPKQYDPYVIERLLPPGAKFGEMLPPRGDGWVTIDKKILPLSPVAQFRNERNLIVMSMSIESTKSVVYVTDNFAAVHRIWFITEEELKALRKRDKETPKPLEKGLILN